MNKLVVLAIRTLSSFSSGNSPVTVTSSPVLESVAEYCAGMIIRLSK